MTFSKKLFDCLMVITILHLGARAGSEQSAQPLTQPLLGTAWIRNRQAVFVFDGEHGIVAKHAQSGNKLGPPLGPVTITAGAEDPATLAPFGVRLGIEHTGARQVDRVELRVLGVDMENGACEYADRGDGIDALPEETARIEVAAHSGSCDGAQT